MRPYVFQDSPRAESFSLEQFLDPKRYRGEKRTPAARWI